MPFLSKAHFKTQIRDTRLTQMIDDDDSIIEQVSSEAVAVLKSYLFNLYDTAAIFDAPNPDTLVVYWAKVVALYILHERLPNLMIPEHVRIDYELLRGQLKDIASGKIAVDLPRKQIDSNGDGIADKDATIFRFGGNPRRSH